MSVHEHKRHARTNLKVGVITASDTRTPDTDESGRLVRTLFEGAGHQVCYYEIIPDDREKLSAAIMSRAIAGVRKGKLIIALPGSTDACKLAMNQLIIPEIGHIVFLLNQ